MQDPELEAELEPQDVEPMFEIEDIEDIEDIDVELHFESEEKQNDCRGDWDYSTLRGDAVSRAEEAAPRS